MPTTLLRRALVAAVSGLLLVTAVPASAHVGDVFFRISCHSVGATTGHMIGVSLQATSQSSSEASTEASSERPNRSESVTTAEHETEADIAAAQQRDQLRFVVANYGSLRRDIAAGGGEYVHAYASLLGCSMEARPYLIDRLRDCHAWLFSGDFTPVEVGEKMLAVIAVEQRLADACVRVRVAEIPGQ